MNMDSSAVVRRKKASASAGSHRGSKSTSSSKRQQQQHQQIYQQQQDNSSNPVVASLSKRSEHPYSSISLSPSRQYVVTACKDTLQLVHIVSSSSPQQDDGGEGGQGLIPLKKIPCSNHFAQTAPATSLGAGAAGGAGTATTPSILAGGGGGHASSSGGVFGFGPLKPSPQVAAATGGPASSVLNVYTVITDVAWSPPQLNDELLNVTTTTRTSNTAGVGNVSTQPTAAGAGSSNAGIKKKQQKKKQAASAYADGPDGSLIAAAGSNGVIVVWTADSLMESAGVGGGPRGGGGGGGTHANMSGKGGGMRGQQQHRQHSTGPTGAAGHHATAACTHEAVLSQHQRAVNRLAWHPTKQGLLLSASQDSTVRLWERRKVDHSSNNSEQQQAHIVEQQQRFHPLSLFNAFHGSLGAGGAGGVKKQSYSWHCRAIYEPRSEAVRDIKWSPYHEDVFAIVTAGGSLVLYNMHVRIRALAKITAHSRDSTTLDWHPTLPNVIATGGATDRCVKIWNLERYINLRSSSKDDNNLNNSYYMNVNANTLTSRTDSVNTDSSNETTRSSPTLGMGGGGMVNVVSTIRSATSLGLSTRHKPSCMMHELSISASVMRLRWRPPARETFLDKDEDRHESMLAVATASIKGASAGGSGLIALWSFHRPFMPLSVVEGHKEGAVTDFDWLDTPTRADVDRSTLPKAAHAVSGGINAAGVNVPGSPTKQSTDSKFRSMRGGKQSNDASSTSALTFRSGSRLQTGSNHESDHDSSMHGSGDIETVDKQVGIWQHVLSVGRDGRCLIQSFARGDRPISRVAPSCFAMTNLSPFQRGFGSLQVFSVCQQVPGPKDDFLLTGLRKDSVTASAPGVFRENPSQDTSEVQDNSSKWVAGNRLPANSPTIAFHIVDQGNLDSISKPLLQDGSQQHAIPVAPEVVHLSRFADQYKLYPDQRTTRAQLCYHNGSVAESLQRQGLAHMWQMVGFMLERCGMDSLPAKGSEPRNAMQFVILQTIENLLQERADEGDVQTCVALCEVLQVVEADDTTRIPGLDINLTREWYLSYIDLLRDMCLFSQATFLIRSSNDPFISSLNQQSTTIHESCPHCGKAIQPDHRDASGSNARRACKNCRRRVGMCFLCHEPVQGMYVWCPGCGHGGHLEHALSWFGGLTGNSVREVCPTGCGHRCNFRQPLTAFPRTDSFLCLPVSSDF